MKRLDANSTSARVLSGAACFGETMPDFESAAVPLILIVEDHDLLREVLQEALILEGYATLAARNGAEGLHFLQTTPHQPHLVLCDMYMNEMSGCDLLQIIRSSLQWHDLPFILLSAVDDPIEICQASDTPHTAYMKKPFNIQNLLELIFSQINN